MYSRLASRGQARVFEAVVACTLILLTTSYAIYYLHPLSQTVSSCEGLPQLAEKVLLYLSQSGLLDRCIYLEDYKTLQQVLEQLLPSDIEYQVVVYRLVSDTWKVQAVISSPLFHRCATVYSSSTYLAGFNGTVDERLVVLSLGS